MVCRIGASSSTTSTVLMASSMAARVRSGSTRLSELGHAGVKAQPEPGGSDEVAGPMRVGFDLVSYGGEIDAQVLGLFQGLGAPPAEQQLGLADEAART